LKKTLEVSTVSSHAGIAGDRLLEPDFLPPRLTGAVYRDFLSNILPELLQDMDLQKRINLWFIHDQMLHHTFFLQFGHSGILEQCVSKKNG
jgi:hypothetical protein